MPRPDKMTQQISFAETLRQPRVNPDDLKRIFKNLIKLYHPDRGPEANLKEAILFRVAKRRGVESFYQVLTSIETKTVKLDEWSEVEQQVYGRQVLFPKRAVMDSAKLVTVRSPREFLLLLDAFFQPGGLTDESIVENAELAAHAAEQAQLLEGEDGQENYKEAAQELLESFRKAGIDTFEKFDSWIEENDDHLHSELLSYPITSVEDGPTTARSWINRRHLDTVISESRAISSPDGFEDFREHVKNRRFFATPRRMLVPITMDDAEIQELLKEYVDPSRHQANRIVRETLIRAAHDAAGLNKYFEGRVERASSKPELFDILSDIDTFKYPDSEASFYLNQEQIAQLRKKARAKKRDLEP